jgi:hypothetical protein
VSASPPQLHYLTFAKVRAFNTIGHPLDPPVLILYPIQPTSDGLMPITERAAIFTSRTLRSVVYYRGEGTTRGGGGGGGGGAAARRGGGGRGGGPTPPPPPPPPPPPHPALCRRAGAGAHAAAAQGAGA